MITKYESLAEVLKKDIIAYLDEGIDQLPPERVIASTHRVSRQTVRQALSLLEQAGYIKSIQGSGNYLTGISPVDNTNEIYLLISTESEYIFPSLISDIKNYFSYDGYSLKVRVHNNHTNEERLLLEQLNEINLSALIIEPIRSSFPSPNYDIYEKLIQKNVPIIFLHGYYSNLTNLNYIKDDNFNGGYTLANYLLNYSHKNIAGIFQLDTIQGQERYMGTARALIDHGIQLNDNNIMWFTQEQLIELQKKQDTRFLIEFIRNKLASCTAVVCYNDEIAYWLIKELTYSGISVPDDVSVVGFDNSYLSELSSVKITSLSHEPKEMAHSIYSATLSLIKKQSITIESVSWTLIERNSCTFVG